MQRMSLIEPDHLASVRVIDDGLPDLPGSKAVITFPFKIDIGAAAIFFHFGFIARVEDGLPGNAKAIAKIPDIHDFLFNEPVSDLRINQLKNSPAVGDGGFAAFRGWGFAKEEHLSRPVV